MGQMGPERFNAQAEQTGFCVEGMGSAGDFAHEVGDLLARNRAVVVMGVNDAHSLDLHRCAVGTHTKNAHRPWPKGAFDDCVCRYCLKHGILHRAQFSILEIKAVSYYTKVPSFLIGTSKVS